MSGENGNVTIQLSKFLTVFSFRSDYELKELNMATAYSLNTNHGWKTSVWMENQSAFIHFV